MPRTYCGDRVSRLAPAATRGDGDPLDICVLSERAITRNEIIVPARVIGGLQMVDRGEADDKIISVLDNDYVWGDARDLRDLPAVLIERLQHYFLTYRLVPGEKPIVSIARVYGRAHAHKVVQGGDGRLRRHVRALTGAARPGRHLRAGYGPAAAAA